MRLPVNRPLLTYFVLTFLITWAFLGPFVYIWRNVTDRSFEAWMLVFLPGAYGPSIAALIMARIRQGKGGVRRLLRRLLDWRVDWRWYVLVGFLPIALTTLAVALSSFRGAAIAGFDPGRWYLFVPLVLIVALPFGPLGEELGWRGYALPMLLERYGIFVSSLILGVIWTFWHTPMFWYPGAAIPSFMDLSLEAVLLYLAQITAEAFLFTVVYVVTGGSVLIAVLFHLAFNTSETILFSLFPEQTHSQQVELYVINVALMWAAAIAALLLLRRSRSDPARSELSPVDH